MIALGAVAERGRLGPALAFVFIWSTLVYDPIAYWTWNKNGWSDYLGVLDFAGGTPVHISSVGSSTKSVVFGSRDLHELGHDCTRYFDLSSTAERLRNRTPYVQAAQYDLRDSWHSFFVVRLVRLQWRCSLNYASLLISHR